MRFSTGAFIAAIFLGQSVATQISRLETRASVSTPPLCALNCIENVVPQYCGSLTNVTCLCTDATLTMELGACSVSVCNVTDLLKLQKYKADTCGVVNDKSRLNSQQHCYYVLPALATLFLLARIYCRVVMEIAGWDDWMMVAAYVSYMIDVGFGQGMMVNRFGLHTYQLTTEEMENNLKYFYICELWYIITITLTKLSLLLFFRRIFPQKNFKITAWTIGIYTAVSNFATLMALAFQCLPFHGIWTNWEYYVSPVKCVNTYAVVYFAAGNSIFQDLAIIILPINIIWNLNLNWQRKANVLVMFSVGAVVILCSVLRIPSLVTLKSSSDPSWDEGPIGIWTNIEQCVGIICGCLPACSSLVGHIWFSKRGHDKTPSGYLSRKASKSGLTSHGDNFIELQDQNDHMRKTTPSQTNPVDSSENTAEKPIHPNEFKAPYNQGLEVRFGASVNIRGMTPENGIDVEGIMLTRDVDQSSARNSRQVV